MLQGPLVSDAVISMERPRQKQMLLNPVARERFYRVGRNTGIFSTSLKICKIVSVVWRRGWDSNPRNP